MKVTLNNVIFEATHACNFHCKHCYNYWKADENVSISNSSYVKCIKTLKCLFRSANIKNITFSGGEPMMAERIGELILFCKLRKTNVNLLTNGFLLSHTEIKQFIDLKINTFQIPVLSYEPFVHDYLTGRTGSWEKAIETIKILIHQKSNVVPVIVLSGLNFKSIEKTLYFLKKTGCGTIMINRFNIGGAGIANKENLAINHSDLKNSFLTINEIALKENLKIQSGVCTPVCVLNPKDYKSISFSFCNNDLSTRPITIDFMGNVRYCNHSPNILGNIHDTVLSNILDSPLNKERFEKKPELCINCNQFSKCKAGCRAASEQLGLDFSHADPVITYAI